MIDVPAREKAAQLLRQFMEGRVSSTEFEEAWPDQSDDDALKAVAWAAAKLSADRSRRRPREGTELNADGRALVERCILFLNAGLEFDHTAPFPDPPRPHQQQFRFAATSILLLGIVGLYLLWGLSSRTAALLMLWGILWVWGYHYGERAFCQPPEGWSVGVVFWPFTSQADYDREAARVISPATSAQSPAANSQ